MSSKTARDYLPEVDTKREFSFKAVDQWSRKLGATIALEGEYGWMELGNSRYCMDGTTAAGRVWFLQVRRDRRLPPHRLNPIKSASPGYLSFLHRKSKKRAQRFWEVAGLFVNKIKYQYQPIWDELKDAGFYEHVENLSYGQILDAQRRAVRVERGVLHGWSEDRGRAQLIHRKPEPDEMSDIASEAEYQYALDRAETQFNRLTNPKACAELQRQARFHDKSWLLRGELFGRLKRSIAPYLPPPSPVGKHRYVRDEDVQEVHTYLPHGDYLRFITPESRRLTHHNEDYNWALVTDQQYKQHELNFDPERGPVEPFAYPEEP